ncbi:MAG: leucine-rich repeat protein [Bacteroidaceae bacterium]|nr:leucine-rich repeat protein [Bacteroidaceae bacterium]
MKQYLLQRFFCLQRVLLFVLFAQLFSLTITATEVIVDGIKYDAVKKAKQATVIANNSNYSGNIVIPSSFTYDNVEYSVTAIGASAFYACKGLTSINIPNSVTSIGESAFDYCNGLTSITIPNSVTSIGESAFHGCSGLTKAEFASIESLCKMSFGGYSANPLYSAKHLYINGQEIIDLVIPNNVTSIGASAFSGCSGLLSVTIPNSVTSIGALAFYDCDALTKAEFASIESLCRIAFYDVVSNPLSYASHLYINGHEITDLVIPNNVTSIGASVFSGCSSLTSVTIPNSVTCIGKSAFWACRSLTSVNIPSSVTSIGERAFYYCSGLESVTIPNSVTSIGGYAFYCCSSLTSVTIPSSVTIVEDCSFYGCSSLKSVTIGNSVTSIGDKAFANCEELMDVYCLAKKAPTAATTAFDGSYPNYITLHVIASVIEDYKAKSPWSSFGTFMAISGDDPSPKIQFADAAVKAICVDNWDINSDGELSEAEAAEVQYIGTRFKGNSKITSFNELQYFTGLTSIGDNTFYNCSSLTSVTIPNSVTSIERLAFSGCNSLTSVTIPNSVTTISGSAFWSCSGLTSVTIPNSVTSIEAGAFAGCGNLTTIKVVDDNPQYDSRDNSNAIIETSTNTLICGCKNTAIPNSVTSIGKAAFDSCSGLTSVIIPNNVTSVGKGAFYDCCDLTSVTIPKSVTSIEGYAFTFCSSLTSVTCLAEQMPTTEISAFNGSNTAGATLHVPESAIEDYRTTAPWSSFGIILPIDEPEYLVGDSNGNGEVEIGDVTSVLTLMATPDATGYNNKAADANKSGDIEIGDITTILTIMAGGE